MKNFLAIILAVCAATGAFAGESAAPAPQPSAQDALIEQVLAAGGTKRALQLLPMQLANGFMGAAQNSGADEAEGTEMLQALKEAFPEDAFVQHAGAALKKNYDAQRYTHFRQLMSTELVHRMNELETAQPSPDAVKSFLAGIAQPPLPRARIKLIQRIDEASQASAMAATATVISLSAGAIVAGGGCDEYVVKAKNTVAKNRGLLEKQTQARVQVMLAFIYRDASDADLETYAQALEEQDSVWVRNIIQAAVVAQLDSGTQNASQKLKKIVLAQKRHKTMFAPKCGQSESPEMERRLNQQRQAEEQPGSRMPAPKAELADNAADQQKSESTPEPVQPAVKPVTREAAHSGKEPAAAKPAVKVAALNRGAGKARHYPGRERDLRNCLDLPTPAEVIACSEK